MTFRALPPHLHTVAGHVLTFFAQNRGLSAILIEAEVEPDLTLRPTFHGHTRDYHTVCVEVTDSGYTDALDRFVLDCQQRGLPVKLFLAVPTGIDMTPIMRRAVARGVGLVEVGPAGGCSIFSNAISLSLSGFRRPNPRHFPRRYRNAVSQAVDTFLGGDPAKGCHNVYEEIEALTRRLVLRTWRNGFIPGGSPTKAPPLDFNKDPWKTVLEYLRKHLTYSQVPGLTDQLLARIIGLTPYRNDTGHKVARKGDLVQRDRKLGTRFEDAVDVLEELIKATRSLRL